GRRWRDSRRRLPMRRSICAFAFGAWTGVRMTLIPSFASRASKVRGNLVSRSSSSISRFRVCCSIHAVFGLLVQARYSTRLLPIETKTSTYKTPQPDGVDREESQARIDSACARRQLRQDCGGRRGAGGSPALPRMLRAKLAETATPSL